MLSPRIQELLTPRLALIPITPSTIRIEQCANGDFSKLGQKIGCIVHTEWPPQHWEPHVLTFMLEQFSASPDQIGWHRYVALRNLNGSRTLIGCLGAFARNVSVSSCEIGYSILPSFERRGYATEAAEAHIHYLRHDRRITRIIAHTFPYLKGSIRVMEKCGMVFDGDGEEPGTIRYSLLVQP